MERIKRTSDYAPKHPWGRTMDWQVLEVLITRTDDIRVASALARVCKFAPKVPPRMIREERQRRDTEMRKRILLEELLSLQTEIGFADVFLSERDYRIDDRKSIVEWCYVEREGEIIFTGFVDEDGAPDMVDLTEYIPVLRSTGFWQEGEMQLFLED